MSQALSLLQILLHILLREAHKHESVHHTFLVIFSTIYTDLMGCNGAKGLFAEISLPFLFKSFDQ